MIVDYPDLRNQLNKKVSSGVISAHEAKTWYDSYAKLKSCNRCDLRETCNQAVWGAGNLKATVLFVGEAPGPKEDIHGLPFYGTAGRFFQKCMGKAGFKKGDSFMTYICKCRPPENRPPTKQEWGTCFTYTWNQLEVINPKLIVAVGATALQALVPKVKKKLGGVRGQIIPSYGFSIIPVWHPSYVLSQQSELRRREMVKDLKIAFDYAFPERV